MLGLAQQAGHELTNDPSAADVLVVNTCAFIDSAKQESIDTILEMAQHKKDGACRRLIVTGCLAERYRDELKKEIPEIDAVLGTGEVPEIVGAITAAARRCTFHPLPASPEPRATPALPTYIYDADTPRLLATPKHYAYVKIAEGCDYKCAFCIIPTLRGKLIAAGRPTRSCAEARALAARGVKELLLISQDTTFYGIDRDERGALARLLRELNTIDGLEWIRLLYLYPTTIDDATLAAMADCDKVCKYIDLPLQHASNRRAQADEATRAPQQSTTSCSTRSATASPVSPSEPPSSSAFPARPRPGRRRALRDSSRDHAVRPRRSLHLFPRGRHVRLRAAPTTCRPGSRRSRRSRVMGLQKRLVPGGRRAARRRTRANGRGRPVLGPRARPERPPVVPGARHRRRGLSDRMRPVELPAGRFRSTSRSSAPEATISIARPAWPETRPTDVL